MKKTFTLKLASVVFVLLAITGFVLMMGSNSHVSAQSTAVYEYQHWTVNESIVLDPNGSGELVSSLTLALNGLVGNGWEVYGTPFVTIGPNNGTVYNVIGRRIKGFTQAPVTVQPPVTSPTPGPLTSTATNCPGYPTPPFSGAVCHSNGGWW